MSEYQYYEFQSIDRPLTAEQQAAMRKLSSRVELSATRAAFNYSYGDFRGEPLKVLETKGSPCWSNSVISRCIRGSGLPSMRNWPR